jgi:hypothetical protein
VATIVAEASQAESTGLHLQGRGPGCVHVRADVAGWSHQGVQPRRRERTWRPNPTGTRGRSRENFAAGVLRQNSSSLRSITVSGGPVPAHGSTRVARPWVEALHDGADLAPGPSLAIDDVVTRGVCLHLAWSMAGDAHGCVLDTNAGRGAPDLRGGAPLVTVVEAAKPRQGDDLSVTHGPSWSRSTHERGLGEGQMAAVVMIIGDVVSERHLRLAISEFVEHYHCERNHQGLGNRLITAPTNDNADPARPIARRERLGGLLSYYYRAVA